MLGGTDAFVRVDGFLLEEFDQRLQLEVLAFKSQFLFLIGQAPNLIVLLEGINETQSEVEVPAHAVQVAYLRCGEFLAVLLYPVDPHRPKRLKIDFRAVIEIQEILASQCADWELGKEYPIVKTRLKFKFEPRLPPQVAVFGDKLIKALWRGCDSIPHHLL